MSEDMAVPSWTPWVTWLLLIIAGQLVRWAIRALVSLFRALGVDASYKLTREITVIGAYGGRAARLARPNLPSTIEQTIYAVAAVLCTTLASTCASCCCSPRAQGRRRRRGRRPSARRRGPPSRGAASTRRYRCEAGLHAFNSCAALRAAARPRPALSVRRVPGLARPPRRSSACTAPAPRSLPLVALLRAVAPTRAAPPAGGWDVAIAFGGCGLALAAAAGGALAVCVCARAASSRRSGTGSRRATELAARDSRHLRVDLARLRRRPLAAVVPLAGTSSIADGNNPSTLSASTTARCCAAPVDATPAGSGARAALARRGSGRRMADSRRRRRWPRRTRRPRHRRRRRRHGHAERGRVDAGAVPHRLEVRVPVPVGRPRAVLRLGAAALAAAPLRALRLRSVVGGAPPAAPGAPLRRGDAPRPRRSPARPRLHGRRAPRHDGARARRRRRRRRRLAPAPLVLALLVCIVPHYGVVADVGLAVNAQVLERLKGGQSVDDALLSVEEGRASRAGEAR